MNVWAREVARSIGKTVAINIIANTDWDEEHWSFVRKWAMTVPEIVNVTAHAP